MDQQKYICTVLSEQSEGKIWLSSSNKNLTTDELFFVVGRNVVDMTGL